ncbi:hypothetical protein PMIN01_01461 [Paraphaeosphaeria minitans]|uniref:Uncharacterized protein n=1 Tax=Paraphaeosphaeria minitans TaxID=565426 RepID=A0A9P6KWW8_9PLEO|nr:hypothetical protein PMIN01_01461 [Paraphaeosphaeria minitans]
MKNQMLPVTLNKNGTAYAGRLSVPMTAYHIPRAFRFSHELFGSTPACPNHQKAQYPAPDRRLWGRGGRVRIHYAGLRVLNSARYDAVLSRNVKSNNRMGGATQNVARWGLLCVVDLVLSMPPTKRMGDVMPSFGAAAKIRSKQCLCAEHLHSSPTSPLHGHGHGHGRHINRQTTSGNTILKDMR